MPNRYQLRVAEALDPAWATWLGIHTMTHNADGTTTIIALVFEQESLFQLLHKLGELGVTLLAVAVMPEEERFYRSSEKDLWL
ncbi:MAG: hypothetical protein R2932_17190 [Caldilineaceae bacterium]